MPEPKLTLPERALLLILMAENTELSNKEIRERYADSVTLTGRPRQKLIEAELIECRKGERNAYFFILADGGWRWCREELSRAVPSNAGSAGQALYAVLGALGRHLDRTGRSLAQIFGNEPDIEGRSDIVGSTGRESPGRAIAEGATADRIELEIRRAYRKLADPAGSWIGLADIRDQLGDIPARDVDGVLRLMVRMPGVRIEEETNQKALSRRDRNAAVVIGERDQHVLAIEAP
jgi:hypothetical protein